MIRKLLIFLSTVFLLSGAFFAGALFFAMHNTCIDFSALTNYDPGRPTIVLDDVGNEWARFQLDQREPISIEQMPQHLIHAFVAAEDWQFFSHNGISWKGIVRSTLVNLYHGKIVQGASTITQQLIKLLFFNAKKTFKRKIKEQLFALVVEQRFTKEQILQRYLNHVYFGCGIYGVQAASQRFWGKNASDLSLDECAVLASIVRSPGNYCPILYPLSAQRRKDVILRSMHKLGFITRNECDFACAQKVIVQDREEHTFASHFCETVRTFLENKFGKRALYSGGLRVKTTLNKKIQLKAQQAFDEQMKKLHAGKLPDVEGSLITIAVSDAGIKALVGGVDFSVSKFNRALQAKRQIGSTFKPLLYSCAIDAGMTFADTEIDEPITIKTSSGEWKPNNVYNDFSGQMTLANALTRSNNIIAIKTFLKVGSESIVARAKKCYLPVPTTIYPSLALGCIDATPKHVAAMFNVFANDGVYVEPHYITWVKDKWGKKIYKHVEAKQRIMSSRTAGQVAKVLELGLQRVKRLWPQKWVDSQAISKTGTADFRTCWFVGSTPELTTTIYIGRDDNKIMGKNIFPLRTAFPIWIALYRELTFIQKQFQYDPSLHEVSVDPITGQVVGTKNEKNTIAILV